jgi:hypothetical protein
MYLYRGTVFRGTAGCKVVIEPDGHGLERLGFDPDAREAAKIPPISAAMTIECIWNYSYLYPI